MQMHIDTKHGFYKTSSTSEEQANFFEPNAAAKI